MTATRIAVTAGEPRAHVELAVGALAPRLISRDATRAHVAVAAAGMVLLGGDHVHVEIDVGPGCTLEIEDVGGTVAYRGARSSWILDVRIGAGGTLLWHGLPFVVTDGADVERRSSLTLESGARAVIRETLVLGRHGERGGRLVSALSVVDSDGPILLERLDAERRCARARGARRQSGARCRDRRRIPPAHAPGTTSSSIGPDRWRATSPTTRTARPSIRCGMRGLRTREHASRERDGGRTVTPPL